MNMLVPTNVKGWHLGRVVTASGEEAPLRVGFEDPLLEDLFRTHYVRPGSKTKSLEKATGAPEPLAIVILKEARCARCDKHFVRGALLMMNGDQTLCCACAGFPGFVFLPSGDAGLTRRATKFSSRKVVVVKFSRSRRRYERQGILVEEQAYLRARNERSPGCRII